MDFFYDELFERKEPLADEEKKETAARILESYKTIYDPADDQTVWFDKIKALSESFGYCSDMKAYKENPDAYSGSVADVSGYIRLAITGRSSSPDMYAVMQILGIEKIKARLDEAIRTI